MIVLVVEDDAVQRRVLAHRLLQLGAAEIIEAADGAAALDLLADRSDVDLVISDLDMPDVDGLELLGRIDGQRSPIAFAIHSALDQDLITCTEMIARARGLRFVGALSKPATSDELRGLLERCSEPASTAATPSAPSLTIDEIREALATGRVTAYYQPKVSFADRRISGAEALVRIDHPDHGLVAPVSFLDAAQRAGLAGELSAAVLDTAVDDLVAWAGSGRHLRVAVNLSLDMLSLPDAAASIHRRVAERGGAASDVEFEITEQTAMSDVGTCLENIARLRMLGYHLAIDDFGVGYSSVQQLVRVPAHVIKLDRSFVTGIVPGSRSWMLVAAFVDLAHSLGMSVVAEGVETDEEWEVLDRAGCDIAQGYLVSRPMAAAEFTAWCDRWVQARGEGTTGTGYSEYSCSGAG